METRVAVIAIIIKNRETVSQLNEILHTYADYIIGRMGLPYLPKKVSIMSVAVDAPQDVISALSGKIGALSGISVKTAYADA
ncbi:MAG: iron-only hydrogenase system regulator [Alphaproteobacteria bacterium]|nr:iron-only hydrogenase system regulator [Alphaproteobacteria bacterium]